jgi:catechol 2,3-dioxygenase-like lactoylglutathione lyase family enzyme
MNITQLGRVIIPVNDQEKAIEFYTETLGFEKRVDVPMGNGYRWVEVGPAGGVATIAVVPPGPEGSAGGRETGITLDTTDVDADQAYLKSKGVDVDEVSRMGDPVPPMFWFRDPEGNTLLIVETSA